MQNYNAIFCDDVVMMQFMMMMMQSYDAVYDDDAVYDVAQDNLFFWLKCRALFSYKENSVF